MLARILSINGVVVNGGLNNLPYCMEKKWNVHNLTLTLQVLKTKILEFANSIDPDEVAYHHERTVIWIYTVFRVHKTM